MPNNHHPANVCCGTLRCHVRASGDVQISASWASPKFPIATHREPAWTTPTTANPRKAADAGTRTQTRPIEASGAAGLAATADGDAGLGGGDGLGGGVIDASDGTVLLGGGVNEQAAMSSTKAKRSDAVFHDTDGRTTTSGLFWPAANERSD
jgi:hypothetical protein